MRSLLLFIFTLQVNSQYHGSAKLDAKARPTDAARAAGQDAEELGGGDEAVWEWRQEAP